MSDKKFDLKWYEILVCCLPIGLVVAGGGLGGLFGGLSVALNFNIIQSRKLTSTKKYIYCILSGVGSVALYIIVVIILAILFPSTFK